MNVGIVDLVGARRLTREVGVAMNVGIVGLVRAMMCGMRVEGCQV